AYETDHPAPEAAEVPPERLWQAVVAAARGAAAGRADPGGIGPSCLTPALVLLDDSDPPPGPLSTPPHRRPAPPARAPRARPGARRAWERAGPDSLATTGNRPLPGGISALCYRQQAESDLALPGRVASYLHLNGWLAFRLTGVRAFDPANASFSGLYGTL